MAPRETAEDSTNCHEITYATARQLLVHFYNLILMWSRDELSDTPNPDIPISCF